MVRMASHNGCLICHSHEKEVLGTFEDLQKVACAACGFVYAYPPPDEDEYLSLYTSMEFWTAEQQKVGHPTVFERFRHDFGIAKDRLAKIGEYKSYGALLDVGCSNGAFVKCARDLGFQAKGIDVQPDIIEYLRKQHLCDVELGDLLGLQYPAKSFDVITLHDVVEHYYDPEPELQEVARVMKDDGLLVIECPDRLCDEAKEQGLEWRHIRYRVHLWVFSQADMEALLNRVGLTIVERTSPIPAKMALYIGKVAS